MHCQVSYHTDTSAEGSISLSGIIFSAPSDGKRFLPTVGVWYSEALQCWELLGDVHEVARNVGRSDFAHSLKKMVKIGMVCDPVSTISHDGFCQVSIFALLVHGNGSKLGTRQTAWC